MTPWCQRCGSDTEIGCNPNRPRLVRDEQSGHTSFDWSKATLWMRCRRCGDLWDEHGNDLTALFPLPVGDGSPS